MQKKILIVDDEPTLAHFLSQDLAETYQVEIAPEANEALAKLARTPYHLLITDLEMPGMDGFSLIQAARLIRPRIGTVLITAYGSQEVRDEAHRLNLDGYLTKPFATAALQTLTAEILAAQATYQLAKESL